MRTFDLKNDGQQNIDGLLVGYGLEQSGFDREAHTGDVTTYLYAPNHMLINIHHERGAPTQLQVPEHSVVYIAPQQQISIHIPTERETAMPLWTIRAPPKFPELSVQDEAIVKEMETAAGQTRYPTSDGVTNLHRAYSARGEPFDLVACRMHEYFDNKPFVSFGSRTGILGIYAPAVVLFTNESRYLMRPDAQETERGWLINPPKGFPMNITAARWEGEGRIDGASGTFVRSGAGAGSGERQEDLHIHRVIREWYGGIAGEGSIRVNDAEYPLTQGMIIIADPGETHMVQAYKAPAKTGKVQDPYSHLSVQWPPLPYTLGDKVVVKT